MRAIVAVISFLVAMLVFCDCASKPPAKPTGLLPTQFFKEQLNRSAELKQFSAKVGLNFKGVKERGAGQGRLIAQLPSHYRLELRDPLGTLRFLVTLSEDNLLAYYPTQKLAYADHRGGRSYLLHLLGADLSYEELQGIFLGLVPKSLLKSTFDKWDWDFDSGSYEGVFNLSGRKLVLHVDGKTAAIRNLEVQSEARGATKVDFTDFSLCCGQVMRVGKNRSISLARLVQLNHPSSKTSVEIDWDEIVPMETPKPETLFKETLPTGVQLHPLD